MFASITVAAVFRPIHVLSIIIQSQLLLSLPLGCHFDIVPNTLQFSLSEILHRNESLHISPPRVRRIYKYISILPEVIALDLPDSRQVVS